LRNALPVSPVGDALDYVPGHQVTPERGISMNIFAYVDRSSHAESVCDHAAWVAQQLGATVELIHAIDQPAVVDTRDFSGFFAIDAPETMLEDRVRLDEMQNRVLIAEGRQLLDAAAERTRQAGAPKVAQRLFQGTVVEHLQQHAQSALLVVVGKRGEGAHRDPRHLGRNLERIVRSAHRPVLIAAPTFTPIQRALLAWDGGRSAGEAVHFLASQPLLHGVPTTLVHVANDRNQLNPAANDAARHLIATEMEVTVEQASGTPAATILAMAEEHQADLVVMGAYGHSRIRSLIIGSTTTELLMQCPDAMLVFH
jgi:nucleotide-binding universal stress UspA family protein